MRHYVTFVLIKKRADTCAINKVRVCVVGFGDGHALAIAVATAMCVGVANNVAVIADADTFLCLLSTLGMLTIPLPCCCTHVNMVNDAARILV